MVERQIEKYSYIDALRGIAILLVIIAHNCNLIQLLTDYPSWFRIITYNGGRGVQLFFLVSAFTLCLSIKNRSFNKEQHPWPNFYIRRFFRIAPLFYVILAIYLIIYYLEDGYFQYSMGNLLANVSFTSAFFPEYLLAGPVLGSWSIGIEAVFYFLLPFLWLSIRNFRDASWALLISLAVSRISHIIFTKYTLIENEALWNEYLFFYFPSQLPAFLLGILLFHLTQKRTIQSKSEENNYIYPQASLAFFFMLHVGLGGKGLIDPHILFTLGFFLLTYLLFLKPIKILVNPFTVFTGKISYSLYFIHFLVIKMMNKYSFTYFSDNFILDYAIRFLFLFGISAIISTITFYCIEQPFQSYGKKLISRLDHRSK